MQGVGFRYFVLRRARALGLVGWVRNEPDGTVAVEADGPREALERLLADLRVGPAGARVKDVEDRWSSAADGRGGFEIA